MRWFWKFAFWIGMFTLFPLLFWALDSYLGLKPLPTFPLGLALLLVSLYMSAAAGRTLKLCGHSVRTKRFQETDVLVKTGIYSCSRHPNQFWMSLIPLAEALMMGSPCGIVASGWALALGLTFMLLVEEPEVHQKFCPEYCEYAKEVPAFSLSPKCFKEALKAFTGDAC